MNARTFILITCFIYMLSPRVFSQAEEKPDIYDQSYLRLQELYKESIEADRRYINGFQYTETFPGTIGHPFFLSEGWFLGELSMDGIHYEGITIRYDLFRDQVLYNHIHPSGSYNVVLNKELTEAFKIDGHLFKKLPARDKISPGIKAGYYELLSEGKASFYVKWQKRLSDPGPESRGEFSLFNEWYILNQGAFRKISGKSVLLKVLGDHEKEIRTFIRENRIVVKPGNEPGVRLVIDYYNHLLP